METVTTEKMSELVEVKPASIRAAYCTAGSYFGVVPKKLPIRRLMWSLRDIEALLQRAA